MDGGLDEALPVLPILEEWGALRINGEENFPELGEGFQ